MPQKTLQELFADLQAAADRLTKARANVSAAQASLNSATAAADEAEKAAITLRDEIQARMGELLPGVPDNSKVRTR